MSDRQLIVESSPVSATPFNALRLAEKSLLNQSGTQPPKLMCRSCSPVFPPFRQPEIALVSDWFI